MNYLKLFTGLLLLFFFLLVCSGPARASQTTLLGTISGNNNSGYFGSPISIVGDINNDGYQDYAVADNGNLIYKLFIFFGGPKISDKNRDQADVTITLTNDISSTSISLVYAGDLNGDGIDDLVISVPFASSGKGQVYIFYGRKNFKPTSFDQADVILTGVNNNDYIGTSLASSDINNDGINDLIVGDSIYPSFGCKGRAYVFYGGSGLTTRSASQANVILTGENNNDYFGNSLTSADVNNDGFNDLIVTTYAYSSGKGRVYVFYGGSGLTSRSASQANVILTGENNSDYFGGALASTDINNDGFKDIIVGAFGYSTNKGRTYVFYGGSGLTSRSASQANVILTGENNSDYFGGAIASADVNSDGFKDIIVGASSYPNGAYKGQAYVFFGGPGFATNPASQANVILTGENNSDRFGGALASADINNDNYQEILIGASFYNARRGKVYIYQLSHPTPQVNLTGTTLLDNGKTRFFGDTAIPDGSGLSSVSYLFSTSRDEYTRDQWNNVITKDSALGTQKKEFYADLTLPLFKTYILKTTDKNGKTSEGFIDPSRDEAYYLLKFKTKTLEGSQTVNPTLRFSPFTIVSSSSSSSLEVTFRTNYLFNIPDSLDHYQVAIQKKTHDPKTQAEILEPEQVIADNIPPAYTLSNNLTNKKNLDEADWNKTLEVVREGKTLEKVTITNGIFETDKIWVNYQDDKIIVKSKDTSSLPNGDYQILVRAIDKNQSSQISNTQDVTLTAETQTADPVLQADQTTPEPILGAETVNPDNTIQEQPAAADIKVPTPVLPEPTLWQKVAEFVTGLFRK